jgi:hypothetical protein
MLAVIADMRIMPAKDVVLQSLFGADGTVADSQPML